MMKQVSTLALVAALTLAAVAPANAQMATFDASQAANVAKQLASAKEQLDQLKSTYDTVTSQLRKAEAAYDAVTGTRNLGDVFNNPLVRQYLPADMKKVYDRAQQGGYKGISGSVDAILASELLTGSAAQRAAAIRDRERNGAATLKLVGDDAYAGAKMRLEQLDQLQGKINETEDPKAIADLQARLAVEQANIANEAVKLQLLQMAAQAEEKLIQQQKVEYGRSMLSSSSSKMSRIK